MIGALLDKEKRTAARETKGDSPLEIHFTQNTIRADQPKTGEIKSYYCKNIYHTAWNCKFQANDVLKGKYKSHSANVVIIEEPPDTESGDDFTEEIVHFKKSAH